MDCAHSAYITANNYNKSDHKYIHVGTVLLSVNHREIIY